MKIPKLIITAVIIFNSLIAISQNAGINTITPDNSAVLDLESTERGLLIPRMTTAQRNAIDLSGNPQSVIIFNTDDLCFQTYVSSQWNNMWCFDCAPTITTHPSSSTICEGDNTDFSVTATGSNLTYQWQVDDGGGWSNLSNTGVYSNVSTSTMNITSATAGMDTYQYRCVVSGSCSPNATSNAATLTVSSSPSITAHPSGLSINVDDNASFSVSATGAGLTYQWQENTGSGWNNISNGGSNPAYSGATSATLDLTTVPSAYDGYDYRCVVSGTCPPSATSNSANLTVSTFTCGTSTVDDIDGNTYNTVAIGTQCWMAENMATTRYADGTSIPHVDNNTDWDNLTVTDKAYCWYGDDISNKATYGALYTWSAASNNTSSSTNPSGVQGVCPDGWHIPSDDEWKQLEGEVDATYNIGHAEWDNTGWRGNDAGENLKEVGPTHWNSPNAATNSSGFTALPGGARSANGSTYALGYRGRWWPATEYSASDAWSRYLYYNQSTVSRTDFHKQAGCSVRCVRD